MDLLAPFRRLAYSLGLWVTIFRGSRWERGYEAVPGWVWNRIDNLPERLYDRIMYFKGRHFRYRVVGRMIGQGMVRYTISRRLRWKWK
jgi:hypothetical protein